MDLNEIQMDLSAIRMHFSRKSIQIKKNLETRSEHLKIFLILDLVQTWGMFCLYMDMSESGLRQVWILSHMQTCSRPDSDLEHTSVRSGFQVFVRYGM